MAPTVSMDDIATLYNFPDYKNVGDHYGAFADKYTEIMSAIEFHDARFVAELCAALPQLAHLKNNEDAVILDLGCGTGNSSEELRKAGFILTYGVDASK